jgi:hypothetical protein
MYNTKHLLILVGLLFSLTAVSCGPSLVIQNVDYSHPLESVLVPDQDNMVHDQRYAVKFSIDPILSEEGMDSVDQIRLIRNTPGFYFVTAGGFENVYVFEPGEGELKLDSIISFPEGVLQNPAFNQRDTYIELVDLSDGRTYNIDENGVQ